MGGRDAVSLANGDMRARVCVLRRKQSEARRVCYYYTYELDVKAALQTANAGSCFLPLPPFLSAFKIR